MDNSLEELENELGQLTPRRPSAGLMDRLEHELGAIPAQPASRRDGTAPRLRFWNWAGWSLAGAAAVIALSLTMRLNRAPAASDAAIQAAPVAATVPPVPALNRYEPVKASSVLYDLREDGTATLPDQSEGRQVRYRYVDTYTWRNPTTNASLSWRVPRDEVRVIRASLD